jgi:formylglycine-generating enzyme
MCKLLSFFVIVSLSLVVAAQSATIDLVPVGNPGNANDPATGKGGVDHSFLMGKFEITAGQYTEFLNAVAKTDAYELYCPPMDIDLYPLNGGCDIKRTGSSGNYSYSVAPEWANRPVNYTSWGDAARFCNWLYNGQPTGSQNLSTTESGSYYLNGATSSTQLMSVVRNPNATWVIPSENEWYKAAYHKNDGITGNYWLYPTGINAEPSNVLTDPDVGNSINFCKNGFYTIGAPYYRTAIGEFENAASPYGTFDQGGNVAEWTETTRFPTYDSRILRGGSYGDQSASELSSLKIKYYNSDPNIGVVGFRVAYIPEPSDFILILSGAVAFGAMWRRRFWM